MRLRSKGRRRDGGDRLSRWRRAIVQPRVEALEPRLVLDSTLVFNEVMYHPAGNDPALQWVELHNQMAANMDISGWSIDGGVRYTFPAGTSVPGKGYLVIAADPAALAASGGPNKAQGPFTGQLNNAGEELRLLNNDGREVSRLEYEDRGDWPVGADGSGASLAKTQQLGNSELAENWTHSRRVGGTPGAANDVLTLNPSLVISEVEAAGAAQFFVEIANVGSSPVDLQQVSLSSSADTAPPYIYSAQVLAPGDALAVPFDQLGFVPRDGDRLFLWDAQQQLLDARRVTGRLRGLDGDGQWLYPSVATPSASNQIPLRDEIVINEVMYHFRPDPPTADTPATYETTVAVPLNALWRYNQSGQNLGTNWAQQSHPVNGSTWFAGQGMLGFETAALGEPIRTTLTNPLLNNPRVITYYFETEFQFNEDPLQPGLQLMLRHFVDDGAVFYLNGERIETYNLPGGTTSANTLAATAIDNAASIGPRVVPHDALINGLNRLSVEVHQVNTASSDIVLGAELLVRRQLTPLQPGEPYSASDEEWIELYNRSAQPVDISGWQLSGAVDFEFDPGTVVPPDGYLVVSNDSAALRQKYASVTIVGDFNGSLNNKTDRIELLDDFGNTADRVQYYDGGYWPQYADGGGSSLELINPGMDNSVAEAWAASDEASKAQWHEYSYRQTAGPDTGPTNLWNEFIFGLLDSGEVLIDDVNVVSDPDGAALQLIQNGSFQNDPLGGQPNRWRIIGNHQGVVVADPSQPSNRVLHLTASGTTEHQHNHAETTFVGNTPVVNGREYEVSFRARWVAGSPQLNSRFYVSRVQETSVLDVPQQNGTPGQRNSTYQASVGPTYQHFTHQPALPVPGQNISVSVQASDPAGIATMTLYYAVNQGSWRTESMNSMGGGRYEGTIPGQAASAIVQFYVEGRNALGLTSTYPAAGRDSRALLKVDDGQATIRPVDTLRIVMLNTESNQLYVDTNIMSNRFVGATVIYNNSEIFYDVGIRLKGSPFGRTDTTLQDSYNLRFRPEQPFRGQHERIALDGSGRTSWFRDSRDEILVKHLMNHAGGMTTMYDDIAYMIAPRTSNSGPVLLQMARYDNEFLDEQFSNGSDGTVFEFELINYSFLTASGNPESLKIASAAELIGTDIRDLGDSKEDYRWNFMIKNNRDRDDYDRIIELAKAFELTGAALDQATQELMDVDQWMRVFAMFSLTGNIDVYTRALDHNIFLYVRPQDDKILVLPWDMDYSFTDDITAPLAGIGNLRKVIDIPTNTRLFHGHLLDMIQTTYNISYFNTWANYYSTLAGENYAQHAVYIRDRANFVLSRLPVQIPLTITTNNGNDFSTAADSVTLQGDGWIDVRQIRLQGNDQPLNVRWIDDDSWVVTLPLVAGPNAFSLVASNRQGQQVGLDSITITSTAVTPTLVDALRITEINYHPHDPPDTSGQDQDDFEFIELTNVATAPIQLQGARFVSGIDFAFGNRVLGPGQFVVLVKDVEAFQSRYGTSIDIAGTYNGNLANGGESLRLIDALGATIADFRYDDSGDWPDRADGGASTLQVLDFAGDYSDPGNWRSSIEFGGSPGRAGVLELADVVINEVLAHTDPPQVDTIELHNLTDQAVDVSGWYLSDSNNNYRKFQIALGTTIDPRGYLVLDETDFNAGTSFEDFALNGARGDDVWLLAADPNGNPIRFADHVETGAQRNGQSWGRWPNGTGRLYPMINTTLGTNNSGPFVGSVVISEVMYNPPDPDGPGGIDPNDLEFIELFNASASVEDLSNWRLAGAVDLGFPAGTMLVGGQTVVVVSFDPTDATRLANFRSIYTVPENALILGGYPEVLDNGRDRIRLLRPDQPPIDEPDFVPLLLEDEVHYDDQTPWPSEPDGGGLALQRVVFNGWGNDPASWQAAEPTPGATAGGESPHVESVSINTGLIDPDDLNGVPQPSSWQRQRSMIKTIVVTFSTSVILSADDLVLTNLGVHAPTQPDVVHPLRPDQIHLEDHVLTVMLDDFELEAGVYRLDILPTVTDLAGHPLDGNGDQVGGDAYTLTGNSTNRLYSIPGDYNGDLGVSIFDFTSFVYWFNRPVGQSPPYLDINQDGSVSIFDFPIFVRYFGTSATFPQNATAMAARPASPPGSRQDDPLPPEQQVAVESLASRVDFLFRTNRHVPSRPDLLTDHQHQLEQAIDSFWADVLRQWRG